MASPLPGNPIPHILQNLLSFSFSNPHPGHCIETSENFLLSGSFNPSGYQNGLNLSCKFLSLIQTEYRQTSHNHSGKSYADLHNIGDYDKIIISGADFVKPADKLALRLPERVERSSNLP